jgi:hypothetical protein
MAMRWSKLKQQVESIFAPDLRGRVELWTTRYTKAHDRFGRSWITLDGQELLNMSNYLSVKGKNADGYPHRFAHNTFAGYDLPLAMRQFLTLSIDQALASPNPLIQALAILDRRTGQPRLAKLNPAQLPPLPKKLLILRQHPTP